MNIIDIIIIVPLIWGIYRGFSKGLIKELAQIGALFIGFWAGNKFSNYASEIISSYFNLNTQLIAIIAFAITFLLVITGVFIVAAIIEKTIKVIALGWANRLTGALFGVLKYLLIIGILFSLILKFDKSEIIISKKNKENSFLLSYVVNAVDFLISFSPSDFVTTQQQPFFSPQRRKDAKK